MKHFYYDTSIMLVVALLMGCADLHEINEPTALERDFGNSVAQVTEAQVYDKKASISPDPIPVTGLEGRYGQNVMSAHRYVANPESVIKSEVTFKK